MHKPLNVDPTYTSSKYCVLDGFSKLPDKVIDPELYQLYQSCMSRLVHGGEEKSLNVEGLKNGKAAKSIQGGLRVRSARLDNRKKRAIFVLINNPNIKRNKQAPEKLWVLESISTDHYKDIPYLSKGNIASAQKKVMKRLEECIHNPIHIYTPEQFTAPQVIAEYALVRPLFHDGLTCIELGTDQEKILEKVVLGKSGPILLEGGPGTGKTTDLKLLRDNAEKGMVIKLLSLNPDLVTQLRRNFTDLYADDTTKNIPKNVTFSTCFDMVSSIGDAIEKKAEVSTFHSWYQAQKLHQTYPNTSAAQAYHECLIIHGQVIKTFIDKLATHNIPNHESCFTEAKNRYLTLGESLTFISKNERERFFSNYASYIETLSEQKSEDIQLPTLDRLHRHLQAAQENPYCIMLDEMQDISPGLLAFFSACSAGHIIMAGNEAQSLVMSGMSSIDWAKRMIDNLQIISLNESYRLSKNITQFMRYMKSCMHTFQGGVISKAEGGGYDTLSDDASNREGDVVVLKTENGLLPKEHKDASVTVIVIDEDAVDKLKEGPHDLLFYTVPGYKGLETPHVMVSMLLSTAQIQAMKILDSWLAEKERAGQNITLSSLKSTVIKPNRPKNKDALQDNSHVLKLLNYIWVAFSRGRDKLTIVFPTELATDCRRVFALIHQFAKDCKHSTVADFAISEEEIIESAVRNIKILIESGRHAQARSEYRLQVERFDQNRSIEASLFGAENLKTFEQSSAKVPETLEIGASPSNMGENAKGTTLLEEDSSSSTNINNKGKRKKKKGKSKRNGSPALTRSAQSKKIESLAPMDPHQLASNESGSSRSPSISPDSEKGSTLRKADFNFTPLVEPLGRRIGKVYATSLIQCFLSEDFDAARALLYSKFNRDRDSEKEHLSKLGIDPSSSQQENLLGSSNLEILLSVVLAMTVYLGKEESNEANRPVRSDFSLLFTKNSTIGMFHAFLSTHDEIIGGSVSSKGRHKSILNIADKTAATLKIIAGENSSPFLLLLEPSKKDGSIPILEARTYEEAELCRNLITAVIDHAGLASVVNEQKLTKALNKKVTNGGDTAPLYVHIEKMEVHAGLTIILHKCMAPFLMSYPTLITAEDLLTTHAPLAIRPLVHQGILSRLPSTQIQILLSSFRRYVEAIMIETHVSARFCSSTIYYNIIREGTRQFFPHEDSTSIWENLDFWNNHSIFRIALESYKVEGGAFSEFSKETKAMLLLAEIDVGDERLIKALVEKSFVYMTTEQIDKWKKVLTYLLPSPSVYIWMLDKANEEERQFYLFQLARILWPLDNCQSQIPKPFADIISDVSESGICLMPPREEELSKQRQFERLSYILDAISPKAWTVLESPLVYLTEYFDLSSSSADVRRASIRLIGKLNNTVESRTGVLALLDNTAKADLPPFLGTVIEKLKADNCKQLFVTLKYGEWFLDDMGNEYSSLFAYLTCPARVDADDARVARFIDQIKTVLSAHDGGIIKGVRQHFTPQDYFSPSISVNQSGMSFSSMFAYHVALGGVWTYIPRIFYELETTPGNILMDHIKPKDLFMRTVFTNPEYPSLNQAIALREILYNVHALEWFSSSVLARRSPLSSEAITVAIPFVMKFILISERMKNVNIDSLMSQLGSTLSIDDKYSGFLKQLAIEVLKPSSPGYYSCVFLTDQDASMTSIMSAMFRPDPPSPMEPYSPYYILHNTGLFDEMKNQITRLELLLYNPDRVGHLFGALKIECGKDQGETITKDFLALIDILYVLAVDKAHLTKAQRDTFIDNWDLSEKKCPKSVDLKASLKSLFLLENSGTRILFHEFVTDLVEPFVADLKCYNFSEKPRDWIPMYNDSVASKLERLNAAINKPLDAEQDTDSSQSMLSWLKSKLS